MRIRGILIATTFLLCFISCQNDGEGFNTFSAHSFYPLAVGNYWYKDNANHTEITKTVTIEGELYYEVISLIGGDAIQTEYLRIDDEKNLILRSNTPHDWYFTKAKFNASEGDIFFTLYDQSVNDHKVTVIYKDDDIMKFEYQIVFHPILHGKDTVTYKKGLGPVDDWKEVRINGVVHKFD